MTPVHGCFKRDKKRFFRPLENEDGWENRSRTKMSNYAQIETADKS